MKSLARRCSLLLVPASLLQRSRHNGAFLFRRNQPRPRLYQLPPILLRNISCRLHLARQRARSDSKGSHSICPKTHPLLEAIGVNMTLIRTTTPRFPTPATLWRYGCQRKKVSATKTDTNAPVKHSTGQCLVRLLSPIGVMILSSHE